MKAITIIFLAFLVGVKADSYQDGFITGMIVTKTLPNTKLKPKYNTVIIDTSLIDFPIQKSPICYENEVRERKYHELSFEGKCFATIIIFFSLTRKFIIF